MEAGVAPRVPVREFLFEFSRPLLLGALEDGPGLGQASEGPEDCVCGPARWGIPKLAARASWPRGVQMPLVYSQKCWC